MHRGKKFLAAIFSVIVYYADRIYPCAEENVFCFAGKVSKKLKGRRKEAFLPFDLLRWLLRSIKELFPPQKNKSATIRHNC